ncbi:MAG: helix-turn-helix domain-containing protein [Candidatus Saccharimonadales bacterium]
MENLFKALDFTEAEAAVYRHLLAEGGGTAAEIAKKTKQTRTNTYMVLNKLLERSVAVADDAEAVRRYRAASPQVLEQQFREQQRALAQTKRSLDEAMPDLLAMFNLSQQKPGVVHLTGYDGLRASFEDQAKSKTELLLWGSDIKNRDPKVWQIIDKGGYKRRARGITTRALFHTGAAQWPHIDDFVHKGFEIRLWGKQPSPGEVLVYDDRVTFTVYQPEIVVTVLTSEVMAQTFRGIFDNCWQSAVPIAPTA